MFDKAGISCILFFFGLLSVTVRVKCLSNYRITFDDEGVLRPCEKFPNDFLTRVFELSALVFTPIDEYTFRITGKLTFLIDIKKYPKIKATADIYKKVRGQWMNTIYSMRREDFCGALFGPLEPWYNFTKKATHIFGTCEVEAGSVRDGMDTIIDLVLPLPDRNADGNYKMEVKLTQPNKIFVCFKVLMTFERI